jgi:hypothetical protein
MRILIPFAAVAVACASAPPRPAVTPSVEQKPELPRSSIAAILLHREDLGLTPTQVETLVRRDDALAREDAALRSRTASSSSSGTPATTPSPSPSPGGRAGRHGARRAPAPAHAPDALTQLDDNDTRAYLEIEEQVLTEAQRPRAREIASAYREALYDQQHPSTVHGRADAGSPP